MSQSISAIISDLRNPQTPGLEPGLLSVFRMMTALQLILVLIGLSVLGFTGTDGPPLWVLGLGLSWLVGLMIYLGWPGLHERLGRWFLPPALLVSILMPLTERTFVLQLILSHGDSDLPIDRIEDSSWRLLIFLLIPLVLTAWQYRMRYVLFFSIGTMLLSILITGIRFGWDTLAFASTWPIAIGQGIFLTLIGYVVSRLINSQRLQRTKLTTANEQLADYAVKVDQLATSRERNRLARELHDTLSHTLSSLSVQLEAADSVWTESPNQARELLVKSIANARSGLAETRRALQDLRASPLEDLGLGLALRNIAESTSKRAGVKLHLDIPKQVEGLSDAQEHCIYRTAQEALENVAKHASAQEIHVGLNPTDDNQWQLTVQDDGLGFDAAVREEEGHYGLRGMEERVEMAEGELYVESQVGQGTTIKLVM